MRFRAVGFENVPQLAKDAFAALEKLHLLFRSTHQVLFHLAASSRTSPMRRFMVDQDHWLALVIDTVVNHGRLGMHMDSIWKTRLDVTLERVLCL
jgi:hypothetical protein